MVPPLGAATGIARAPETMARMVTVKNFMLKERLGASCKKE
jgi:hypothetical protein